MSTVLIMQNELHQNSSPALFVPTHRVGIGQFKMRWVVLHFEITVWSENG